ncbi:MAG: VOC family protein [Phreatobacter sp.]|uniref:VOC family protein n=1 Tax=Phreatobacter sp. TaxID=1966341 RepID=UPI001A5D228F|nr:VOC family protein [Phreatobacter sp.]MBL8570286.1 VOC family protein [Phreatobacter sp.]
MSEAEPASPIGGLDHIVVAVADLATAAASWSVLGFTLSPRGYHGRELGTANHTIMLGHDYVELLGVAEPTAYSEPTRGFLTGGDGVEHLALAADDADAAAAFISAQGSGTVRPGLFGRAVERADGARGEARFGIVRWPAPVRTAGIGLFVCHHVTPEWVWLPELTSHRNGAVGIATIFVAAADPAREARAFSRAVGRAVVAAPQSDALVVGGGRGRADIRFATRAALEAQLSAHALAGARSEGVVAIDIATRDIDSAVACAGALWSGGRVPAGNPGGISLGFVAPAP